MLNFDAIWMWFLAHRPSDAATNSRDVANRHVLTLLLYEDGGELTAERPLVFGIYGGNDEPYIGAYVMYPNGRYKSRNYKAKRWQAVSLAYIGNGGYSYWGCGNDYAFRMARKSPVERIAAWITGVSRSKGWWTTDMIRDGHDIVRFIGSIETNYNYEKRKTSREKKEKAITDWVLSLRSFPKDFDAVAARVCFGDRHFAFEDRDNGVYEMSCCSGIVPADEANEIEGWKNNKTIICPLCGASAKVRKSAVMRERMERARMLVLCRHVDRDGKPCVWSIFTTVERHWTVRAAQEWQKNFIDAIIPLPLHGWCDPNMIVYGSWGDTFSDKNCFHYRFGATYAYPDMSPLEDTDYRMRGLAEAAAMGWRIDYDRLMWHYGDVPQIEYIIKAGLERVTREMTTGYYPESIVKDKHAKKLSDALGIDGQALHRLREMNGGVRLLFWLRDMKKNGYKLSDDTLRWLNRKTIRPDDFSFAAGYGLTYEQCINYIRKQQKETGGSADFWIGEWRDTLEMEKAEKCDMTMPANIKPKDLRARHDELVKIRNARWDKERAQIEASQRKKAAQEAAEKQQRLEQQNRDVAAACTGIRERFEWSDGVHMAVVPGDASDIAREGVLLGHCVASNDIYLDRIMNGDSYIVFIRRAKAPDTPWFTAEVEPSGKVRQLRTHGNSTGLPEERKEAKEFLAAWQKKVKSRMSAEELRQAETATERYLRELQELIASGTTVRRGAQQGQLLGQVLSDDYDELNEKEVAV